MKRIFPKIQFFATTHSPQVIGQAKPEEIVLLTKDGKQKRPAGSFGMDSNWVLECVMEADGRDPKIAKRIKALFDLIEDDRFDEAKAEMARLKSDIGPLAPDVVAAKRTCGASSTRRTRPPSEAHQEGPRTCRAQRIASVGTETLAEASL